MYNDTTGIRIKQFRSIKKIEDTIWNSIEPKGEFHLTFHFSLLMESAKIPGVKFYYAIFYQEGKEPFYKLPLMTFEVKFFRFLPGPLKNALLRMNFPVAILGKFKVLTTQSLFHLTSANILDESKLQKNKGIILDYLNKLCRNTRSHFFLITDKNVIGFKKKFVRFQGPYNSYLDLNPDWISFDDYLFAMRHNHRKRIIKKRRLNKNLNISVIFKTGTEINATEFHKLFMNVLNKYSNAQEQFNLLTRDYFSYVKKLSQDQVIFVCAYKKTQLIGFVMCTLDNPGVLCLEILGMDYKNTNSPVYFEMLYRLIDFAISNKINRIDFGVENIETKLYLGARAVPLAVMVLPVSRISRIVMNLIASLPVIKNIFNDKRETLARNIFKIKTVVW